MNKDLRKERLLELLADEVLFELDEKDKIELDELLDDFPEFKEDNSFESIATAIGLTNIDVKTEMPHNLQAKVLTDADKFFDSPETSAGRKNETSGITEENRHATQESKTPIWQWLTPVFAGIGCVALIANIWISYNQKTNIVDINDRQDEIEKPKELTNSEKRQELLASANDVIKTNWTSPDENNKNLAGEIVWSDENQEGYMTLKGFTKNDIAKETYQLWIFRDENLEPHPIDGGIFDVNKDGEMIIPVDAKLNVKKPKVFAVTVEKTGGVVVSERNNIAAIAKVTS